jgi:hypothetical protein
LLAVLGAASCTLGADVMAGAGVAASAAALEGAVQQLQVGLAALAGCLSSASIVAVAIAPT